MKDWFRNNDHKAHAQKKNIYGSWLERFTTPLQPPSKKPSTAQYWMSFDENLKKVRAKFENLSKDESMSRGAQLKMYGEIAREEIAEMMKNNPDEVTKLEKDRDKKHALEKAKYQEACRGGLPGSLVTDPEQQDV